MIMTFYLTISGTLAQDNINSIGEVFSKLVGFFQRIVDGIATAIEALKTLYEMLYDFDTRVIQMADSCGTSEFAGMPVKEAIATFRYLSGDVCFMMIYLTVLFGCLFTIYKLVMLLYEAIDSLVLQVSGVSCKFRMPRVGNKIIEPLTNDEAQIIDDTFNINLGTGCRNLAIFHCLLDQGMRTGEVINLKLDDVNFGEDYLVIRLSKAKKSRILPLSHVAKKYLKRYIDEKRPQASHPYVFCVENGERLTQDAIKSIFQRMRKSTGLKRVYPHLLRHTFGTSFILGGGSVEILRVMMGHSDIKTTESYLHIANELRFMDNIYRLDKVFLKKYY